MRSGSDVLDEDIVFDMHSAVLEKHREIIVTSGKVAESKLLEVDQLECNHPVSRHHVMKQVLISLRANNICYAMVDRPFSGRSIKQ